MTDRTGQQPLKPNSYDTVMTKHTHHPSFTRTVASLCCYCCCSGWKSMDEDV